MFFLFFNKLSATDGHGNDGLEDFCCLSVVQHSYHTWSFMFVRFTYFSKLTGKCYWWVLWGCRYSLTTYNHSKAVYNCGRIGIKQKNNLIHPILLPIFFPTSKFPSRNWCWDLQSWSINLLKFNVLVCTWFKSTHNTAIRNVKQILY